MTEPDRRRFGRLERDGLARRRPGVAAPLKPSPEGVADFLAREADKL